MDILYRAFHFIGDEQNARALGIIGAIIAALAVAGWAIFKHFSSKDNGLGVNSIPSLEEYRKILENERKGLADTVADSSSDYESNLRRQISELDKKLKHVEESYRFSVEQNQELTNRLNDLSSSGAASHFAEGIAAFNVRNLDGAEKNFSEYLKDIGPQLKDAASALLGIAMARAEKADWRGAAEAYSKSLMLHENEYALGQASKFLWYSGDHQSALGLSARLVDLTVRTHGEQSEATARARALMAGQLYDLGDLSRARTETTAALATLEELGLREDCFYFNLMMNMANINFVDGDLEGAEDYHQQALDGMIANSCDPELLTAARNGLAETFRTQGKLTDARGLLDKNLEQSRSIFGDRHPHTARALNFLAKCEFDQGDTPASLKHLLLALEIQAEKLGNFHHNSISIASNILGISREYPEHQSEETDKIERKYGAIIDQALAEVQSG